MKSNMLVLLKVAFGWILTGVSSGGGVSGEAALSESEESMRSGMSTSVMLSPLSQPLCSHSHPHLPCRQPIDLLFFNALGRAVVTAAVTIVVVFVRRGDVLLIGVTSFNPSTLLSASDFLTSSMRAAPMSEPLNDTAAIESVFRSDASPHMRGHWLLGCACATAI